MLSMLQSGASGGNEMMNTVGCSDCHDARTMELKPARPALYEAWQRAGKDVNKARSSRNAFVGLCTVPYRVLL